MESWRENEEVSSPLNACHAGYFFQLVTYVGATLLKIAPFTVYCFQLTENLNLEMKKKEGVFDVFL